MPANRIATAIEPLRQSLLSHPLYHELRNPGALRIFLQHHVFAVWDFMSLLKALQQRLTCVANPWVPSVDPAACRLVNEIVLGEESDEDGRGGYASHFELYRRAMTQFGADTSGIDRLLTALRGSQSVSGALTAADASPCIRQFVEHTFAVIETGDLCRIGSAFTYGREDLLPGVFQKIVDEIDARTGGGLEDFQFYLARHIALDGGEHGPMAERLIASLCGDDEDAWRRAEGAAFAALRVRLALWDGIQAAISSH